MGEINPATLTITKERSYFVRPNRCEISPRCTNLSGITSDDIRAARTLPEVIAKFEKEFSPATPLCCTWGDDASLIEAACRQHSLRTPLRNVLDIAPLFQSLFVRQMASLKSAVAMLGLTFNGVLHGALPDARNTALVYAAMLGRIRREADSASVTQQAIALPEFTPFGAKLSAALGKR